MTDKKEVLIEAMRMLGYHYNIFDSYDSWIVFDAELGRMYFENGWKDVCEWLQGVVIDDPELAEQVAVFLSKNL